MTLEYVDRVPTPEEHRTLAEAVGWTHGFAVPQGMTGMFRVVPAPTEA